MLKGYSSILSTLSSLNYDLFSLSFVDLCTRKEIAGKIVCQKWLDGLDKMDRFRFMSKKSGKGTGGTSGSGRKGRDRP